MKRTINIIENFFEGHDAIDDPVVIDGYFLCDQRNGMPCFIKIGENLVNSLVLFAKKEDAISYANQDLKGLWSVFHLTVAGIELVEELVLSDDEQWKVSIDKFRNPSKYHIPQRYENKDGSMTIVTG